MTYFSAITIVHTALSLVALVAGVPAVAGLFRPGRFRIATRVFLWSAVLTTATGFIFPGLKLTPAVVVGVLATLVFAAMAAAVRQRRSPVLARAGYAAGLVASLYLLVFVGIAQAFLKIGVLKALAPTGTEPAFAITQGLALVGFLVIGYAAVRTARAPRLAVA